MKRLTPEGLMKREMSVFDGCRGIMIDGQKLKGGITVVVYDVHPPKVSDRSMVQRRVAVSCGTKQMSSHIVHYREP